MNSPPESLPLAELQARFAAMLRAGDQHPSSSETLTVCIVDDGIAPVARARVYSNNVRAMFTGALERTYPVLRRRVGVDFFARLAAEYRSVHPSRSGDLHWIGSHFPHWIGARMAGTEYAWLADLARLEWACEEVLVSEWLPPAPADLLAHLPPEELAGARLALQSGLRTVDSTFPVWSVWQANQPDSSGEKIDHSLGAQQVVIAQEPEGLTLHSLPADQFRFVLQLVAGRSLENALEVSLLPVERLGDTLAWLFGSGLVVNLTRPGDSNRDGDPQ